MRKLALIILAATGAILLAVVSRGTTPEDSAASSHREAPLISEDPAADNTDLYAFRSPDKPNTLTIISNFIPGEDPAAGPNYYTFSPRARYNIHIDRTGDGRPEITYRFKFRTKPGPLFLGNTEQPYTVERIAGGRSQIVARGKTPPNNIGPRTLMGKDYRQLAQSRVANLRGGGQVFAGQRDDAFYADIGAIFDLLAIRKGTGDMGGGKDFFAKYGVHTIALQIPIANLKAKGNTAGVWMTTERPRVMVNDGGSNSADYVQVQRLGNPLVNEVIIPTSRKDHWNRSRPHLDAQFAQYYTSPILAKVINSLYGLGVQETNRADLVAVLLTGVPGLNFTGPTRADMLRINLGIAPTAAVGAGNRLGVVGGDLAGFPNGRRLEDDVVDIAERAVGGVLIGKNLPLGDGVDANDVPFAASFPYVQEAPSGFDDPKGEQKP
jgi:Domain of unknown function (DUF4331)